MSGDSIFPQPTGTTQPFWEATKEHRLLVQVCLACETRIFYPRDICPTCLDDRLSWIESTGRGVVHAVTRVHHPALQSVSGPAPFLVGLVELAEGIRLPTNLVGFDSEEPRIGAVVEVDWLDLDDRSVPLFRPVQDVSRKIGSLE